VEQGFFIGREDELNRLSKAFRKKTASLIVIKGRRRVGKSRLAEELASQTKFYRFTGLAPNTDTTAQSQRDRFALQLHQQTGLPEFKTDDWSKLFTLLNERVKTGSVVILFDEITWMGSKDPNFLSKLHAAWEDYYKRNPKLILILCGSVSAWIENNILSSTGYFGRISIKLTLEELAINHCNELMSKLGFKRSSYERLMLLSIMGGIPWYIEQIDPGLSASENIKQLCFTKEGLLVDEYQNIFHDLFNEQRRTVHKAIVEVLADGPADYQTISQKIQYHSGGALSGYLEELEQSGYISRDYVWNIKSAKPSSLSCYRLRDNYLRFYLKFILPKLDQINKQQYLNISIETLQGIETVIALQIENLILNNRRLVHKLLGIDPNSIVNDNPYFQHATTKQQGCQIDYLIQTKHKTLYACEIKFSVNKIGTHAIKEVQQKIERLNLPKGYACLPVLIVANGVEDSVIAKDYFFKIIDMTTLLEAK
jgi:uncharacterized protein